MHVIQRGARLIIICMCCIHTISLRFVGQNNLVRPIQLKSSLNGYLFSEVGLPQLSTQSVSNPAIPIHISMPTFTPPNLSKMLAKTLPKTGLVNKILLLTPLPLQNLLNIIYPEDLIMMLVFRTLYARFLKVAHNMQIIIWQTAHLEPPNKWSNSILGFMYERSHMLSKLITFNYCAKVACAVLSRLGFQIHADLPDLLSRLSYALFLSHFVDLFKTQFLQTFFPKVSESKRQSYIINKSASVVIWTIGALVACEMVSTFLKVPLSSTLAFGGVGGLAVGLSLRDIAANFMGGMMLLFNEPFTPGDTVTFQSGNTEVNHLIYASYLINMLLLSSY